MAGGWGWAEGVTADEHRASFGGDKNVLENVMVA